MALGINKVDANLHFIKGSDSAQGIAGFLQAFFGQCVAVPRKIGAATVISGQTSIVVADTKIAATDVVVPVQTAKGTNAVVVTAVTIQAGVSFTITVNTDPGAGGQGFNYVVFRPVSS